MSFLCSQTTCWSCSPLNLQGSIRHSSSSLSSHTSSEAGNLVIMTDGLMGEHPEEAMHMQVRLLNLIEIMCGIAHFSPSIWALEMNINCLLFSHFTVQFFLNSQNITSFSAEPVVFQFEFNPLQLLPDYKLRSIKCQR